PPGNSHAPAKCAPALRCVRSTRPPSTITAADTTTVFIRLVALTAFLAPTVRPRGVSFRRHEGPAHRRGPVPRPTNESAHHGYSSDRTHSARASAGSRRHRREVPAGRR